MLLLTGRRPGIHLWAATDTANVLILMTHVAQLAELIGASTQLQLAGSHNGFDFGKNNNDNDDVPSRQASGTWTTSRLTF